MTVNNVVTIRGLDHRYGATHALRGVDLTVAAGECVALLGPNGAGKTTLVGALTGMLAPSAGIARIDGADPRRPATRRRLGVVHQQAGFPRTLKVRELVSGWAVRAGRPASDADAVLTEVSLRDLTKRRVTALSGGQQQRLQRCSSSTSRPSGWTSTPVAGSGPRWPHVATVAPPSCSPPTRSRRQPRSPIASSCFTRGP
jgi:ABC-2 type transport system ATP-binding protein